MSHRQRLETRRAREGFDFEHGGIRYTACVGSYRDGRIAELFLSTTKAGSSADAIARDAAYVFSLALQYGCPLEAVRSGLLRGSDGCSAGVLGRALELILPPPEPDADPVPPPPPPSPLSPAAQQEAAHAVP